MYRTPTRHTVRLWAPVLAWGLAAYLLHKIGALGGLYLSIGWFQNLTHAASASALAAIIAAAALLVGFREARLVAVVVALTAVGALSWELVEYLGLLDPYGIWLQFHSVEDATVDMVSNAVGVTGTLFVLWVRTGLEPPATDRE